MLPSLYDTSMLHGPENTAMFGYNYLLGGVCFRSLHLSHALARAHDVVREPRRWATNYLLKAACLFEVVTRVAIDFSLHVGVRVVMPVAHAR